MYQVTIKSYASDGHKVVELSMPEIMRKLRFQTISRMLCDNLKGELTAQPKIGMILGRITIRHLGLPGFGERLRKALIDADLKIVNPQKLNDDLSFGHISPATATALLARNQLVRANATVGFLKANLKRLVSAVVTHVTGKLAERIGLFWVAPALDILELIKYARRFWREGVTLECTVETVLDAAFAFGVPVLAGALIL